MTAPEENDLVRFKCSESIITCQICMEIFESPRILPCQHNFCKICVISLIRKYCLHEDGRGNGIPFPCPICRKECKIRQKGNIHIDEHLKGFPENLLLKSLLESVDEPGKGKLEEKPDSERNADTQPNDLFLSFDDNKSVRGLLIKYAYFLCTIQYFITKLNLGQPSDNPINLNRVTHTEVTNLLYDLCFVAVGEFRNQVRYSFMRCRTGKDLSSLLSYISHSEENILRNLGRFEKFRPGWDNASEDTFDMNDAQTQTDNTSVFLVYLHMMLTFLKYVFEFLEILIILSSGVLKHNLLSLNALNTIFVFIFRAFRTFLVLWYLLECTMKSILILYGTCFIILLIYMFFFYNRHGLRLGFSRKIIHVATCSWYFVDRCYRNYIFVYAMKNIITLFDFWLLCKLFIMEIVERIIVFFLTLFF